MLSVVATVTSVTRWQCVLAWHSDQLVGGNGHDVNVWPSGDNILRSNTMLLVILIGGLAAECLTTIGNFA